MKHSSKFWLRPESTIRNKLYNRWLTFRCWCSNDRSWAAFWSVTGFFALLGGEFITTVVLLAGEQRVAIPCFVMLVVLIVWAGLISWCWYRWYQRNFSRFFRHDVW